MNKDNSITLSEKHGLNPSIIKCFVCGEDVGIALMGRLKDDAEAPRECMTGELCDKCKELIDKQKGAFILEVTDDTKEDEKNPYRTGRLVGISKEAKERWNIVSPIVYMHKQLFSQMFDQYLNNKE
jgi:hypothetical protein